MEGSSSLPSDSNRTSSGASSILANLPSRGLFSSTVISLKMGGMRVYNCERDMTPPEGQQIKTDPQNILIRSLMLQKQKGSSSKDVGGVAATEASRKRVADRVLEKTSSKRANSQTDSLQEVSNRTHDNFYSLTVERLRALLKERGLSTKGRKDELVARLRSVNGQT